ncbi:MAG: glycine zipper 2TM domain-containing protein [Nitrospiraceae bacterium]|nr:glycine zipper 2TM domain-containing protein [Nitrospiraceae bacterium]
MKKFIAIALLLALAIFAYGCETPQGQGAGVGAVIGGIAGALIDRNPWRGGVIGGALGAVAGATLTDIAVKANQQAYETGRPVEYRTDNGEGVYRAAPEGRYYYPDEHTRCRKVREKVWNNGRLVKDQIKEVCTSTREENRY